MNQEIYNMASIEERLKARAEAAIARQGNQNEVDDSGSGEKKEFKTCPAGKTKLRMIGYIEQGPQAREYQGKPKDPANKFVLRFAAFGAGDKYKNEDGSPIILSSKPLTVSRNSKAAALKVFQRMCPKRDKGHFMELLNDVFFAQVVHVPGKKADGSPITFANIDLDTIEPALKDITDDEDNIIGQAPVACEEAPAEIFQLYEWDVPSKEDFDKLWPKDQEKLRGSVEFKGSALEALVGGGNPASTEAPEEEQEDEENTPAEPTTTATVDESDLPPL